MKSINTFTKQKKQRAVYQKVVQASIYNIGPWLSAALEDPAVCDEMKKDIAIFFNTLESFTFTNGDIQKPWDKLGKLE